MIMDNAALVDTLLKIASGIAIAVVTAWTTVWLSRSKFRSERLWEKKVAAYERVIDAFHGAKKFAAEHLDAEYTGTDLAEDRAEQLRRLARGAQDEILRASDIGGFILSDKALGVLARYEAESKSNQKCNSWAEFLDMDCTTTDKYMREFIQEAKADLRK